MVIWVVLNFRQRKFLGAQGLFVLCPILLGVFVGVALYEEMPDEVVMTYVMAFALFVLMYFLRRISPAARLSGIWRKLDSDSTYCMQVLDMWDAADDPLRRSANHSGSKNSQDWEERI
ncbi:hypothetical protein [Pandoraea sputorum]|uniref:Uncharacterized protein n=1 Tax=Pandoraea sputorum TaxID=93222 RepID=A0A5E5B479_9BURK|nr:hypothetical protein [Pandoraea sputorum]VVE79972.1 hypothetical protein PSP31121_02392 [Pandoraea sputorum]